MNNVMVFGFGLMLTILLALLLRISGLEWYENMLVYVIFYVGFGIAYVGSFGKEK
jgi:hypothetical protein